MSATTNGTNTKVSYFSNPRGATTEYQAGQLASMESLGESLGDLLSLILNGVENIKIEANSVNLNTDELEGLLQEAIDKQQELIDNTARQPQNTSTAPTAHVEDCVTVPDADGVVALSQTDLLAQYVVIIGRNAAREDNAGDVWIGTRGEAGTQGMKLEPGMEIYWSPSPGQKINLAGLYVQAGVAGDGVSYIAQL